MGMLDHRRGWIYVVSAPPRECIQAFESAFNGKGGLMLKAKWSVRSSGNGATATYEGRKGFGAVAGALSRTAAQEGDTAVGSEVEFNIESTDGPHTTCTMALVRSGRSGIAGTLGATSDARFIRPYMQAVKTQLLALDPGAQVRTT